MLSNCYIFIIVFFIKNTISHRTINYLKRKRQSIEEIIVNT